MSKQTNGGPGGRVAQILRHFTPKERIKAKAICGDWIGWSVLQSPSTGDPDVIRLLKRDGSGRLTQTVTLRNRPRVYVRPVSLGSIENHPDFE